MVATDLIGLSGMGLRRDCSRVIKSQLDRGINSGVLLHNSVTIANNIVYFKLFRKKDF